MKLSSIDIRSLSAQLGCLEPLNLELYQECVDHTVSRETFSLYREPVRDLLVTHPQPPKEKLSNYYESEDYISHTDYNRNLVEKLYQMVRDFSLKRKLKLVNKFNYSKRSLLDIGCGTGDFLRTCQDDGWSVTGIEPNQKAQTHVNRKIGLNKCHSTIDELIGLNGKKYNVITMWHVLEHIPDLHEYIAKVKSLLKSNGSLVIAVPNFKSCDARHYGPHWAAYDVPRHLWHFSRKSVDRIFSEFGMSVIKETPLYFDSFYVSLLSEKYKHGKQKYLPAVYQGLRSNWKARSTGEYSSLIYWIK